LQKFVLLSVVWKLPPLPSLFTTNASAGYFPLIVIFLVVVMAKSQFISARVASTIPK